MNVLTAQSMRLGDRSGNQDRCLILSLEEKILLAVADGMGGHARGDLAAQTAIDCLQDAFERQPRLIKNPATFLRAAINTAHLDILKAGRDQPKPIDPRTVLVVCIVQGNHAWWAHVGDSRLYLLRFEQIIERTRDHTPLEEMLSKGEITEEETHDHPLRNMVSRGLGGNSELPQISFGDAALRPGDLLLLCSDGLWSALPETRLSALHKEADLNRAVVELTGEAEKTSHPNSDNISLVTLRWLNDKPAVKSQHKQITTPDTGEPSDPVQQAIDNIHRAMIEYSSELKEPLAGGDDDPVQQAIEKINRAMIEYSSEIKEPGASTSDIPVQQEIESIYRALNKYSPKNKKP